jgi:hypothetical protein
MTSEPTFCIKIDVERNLARTRYSGAQTGAGMREAALKVESLLPKLKPGFTVFADFSNVASMDFDCVPHLTRVMDLCRAHGVSMVVRLLPKPEKDIGINLLSIVHYRGKIKMVTVDTIEEAERVLGE